ncbi:AI-2E family transporter [bacterium]|nr:AI-2E family transporter [bacterium]
MNPSVTDTNPIYRRIFLVTIFLVVLLAFILSFHLISDLLVVLIISVILTYVFKPCVAYLEHRGVHRVISIVSIFVLGLLLLAFGAWFFVPILIEEGAALIDRLKSYDFVQLHSEFVRFLDTRLPVLSGLISMEPDQAQVWLDRISAASTTFLQQSHKFLAGAINIIALATLVPFLTFFFLKDGSVFMKRFIEKIPNRYFEMTLSLAYRIDRQMGNYILSVLVESAVIGVMTWVALEILGIKFAIVLGLLNGLLNSIPFFGPFIAYFPILLVVLITSGDAAVSNMIWTMVILIGVQIIDNVFAKPLLISRSVNIHPATVLLAVLIGGKLAGALGMFIAVPVYAIIMVIIIDSYDHLKRYKIF